MKENYFSVAPINFHVQNSDAEAGLQKPLLRYRDSSVLVYSSIEVSGYMSEEGAAPQVKMLTNSFYLTRSPQIAHLSLVGCYDYCSAHPSPLPFYLPKKSHAYHMI